ncbi:hypothetical protein CM1200mP19_2550 [bacterium]|nr:MAG: hypothetical protein CM1200mP19_2550 [bacterium]
MAHIDVPDGDGLERLRVWERVSRISVWEIDAMRKATYKIPFSFPSGPGGSTNENRPNQRMSYMTRYSSCIGDAAGTHRGDVLARP